MHKQAEARAIALNELYNRTHEKVKASGGMKTHQQAMEEIIQQSKGE
jgi:hypothetical protein